MYGNAADKVGIVFNGGQHAREWIGPMTNAYIANQLLSLYDQVSPPTTTCASLYQVVSRTDHGVVCVCVGRPHHLVPGGDRVEHFPDHQRRWLRLQLDQRTPVEKEPVPPSLNHRTRTRTTAHRHTHQNAYETCVRSVLSQNAQS
jgi:hypothetical protein